MIGQKNLIEKINQYTIDTFPRSVIIIGEKGMGKHTLVDYIKSQIVQLPLIDMTGNISDEYIDEIYRNPNPAIYMIDLSEMTEKSQNVLLKFVEEPLNNSFIIILAENKNVVLNTIINRCISFEMEAYSRAELATFLTSEEDRELILDVLRSPGKIRSTNINNMRELFELCDKVVNKLAAANYSNMLTIANKINFKDDYSKFDIDIFFDTLSFCLLNSYIKEHDNIYFKMYNFTRDARKKLLDKRLNKELFFENYLTKLWLITKGGN